VFRNRRRPVYHDRPPRLGPVLLWRLGCRLYATGHFRMAKAVKGATFLVFRAILPPEAVVGAGVRLEHYGLGVVIHPNTVIGDRCRIYHGVTLGSSANIGSDDRIVIGDDVLIGAHAVVINRIGRTLCIGTGSRIGANALVVDDVPAGATVLAPQGRVVGPASPTRPGDGTGRPAGESR
jgi:serine O-acetyltransferase